MFKRAIQLTLIVLFMLAIFSTNPMSFLDNIADISTESDAITEGHRPGLSGGS